MAHQRDAYSKPCVLVTTGRSASVPARASAADEVYSFWGYTPHFGVYIAESLLGTAASLAEAVKDGCENDYERLRHYFAGVNAAVSRSASTSPPDLTGVHMLARKEWHP